MNKRYLFVVFALIFLGFFLVRSLDQISNDDLKESVKWYTLAEAQSVAASSDKLIFVDVYEIGCKYCRAMDREVFPDSTVQQVMYANYIPVRLDGNSTEPVKFNGQLIPSKELAQSKGAYVFPTSLILDAQGNVIKKKTGYMGVDEFRQFLYQ
ncbi:thioredoxin fold domain-containing protein [Gracilimonas sp.]|uniref:thioredoxin family protein n=1 Tax=Gracilimonas sp. TaxID=1974203 RepID=UPI0032EC3102